MQLANKSCKNEALELRRKTRSTMLRLFAWVKFQIVSVLHKMYNSQSTGRLKMVMINQDLYGRHDVFHICLQLKIKMLLTSLQNIAFPRYFSLGTRHRSPYHGCGYLRHPSQWFTLRITSTDARWYMTQQSREHHATQRVICELLTRVCDYSSAPSLKKAVMTSYFCMVSHDGRYACRDCIKQHADLTDRNK